MAEAEKEPESVRWGASHVWLLLTYPRRPRLFTALVLCTVVQFLVRLLCHFFDPLPGHAAFLPGFMLGPLAAVIAGPAGVWSAPLASLLADVFLDGRDGAEFRAAGAFASALHVFVCWDSSFRRRVPALHMPATWCAAFRFTLLSVLGGLVAVAWSGLRSELSGLYPFGHVAALEGEGMLERAPSPEDGRAEILSLTGTGRAVYAELGELAKTHDRALRQAVGPEVAARLDEILRKMISTV